VVSKGLVLVVDDDPGFLGAITSLLRAHDYEVESFESAEEFSKTFKSPDALCLILDISLGETSGIDLHRHLATSRVLIPVILITGNGMAQKAALDSGCVACLLKPFTGASLMDIIEGLRSRRAPMST
jgi:FixJ family two-component response regulator